MLKAFVKSGPETETTTQKSTVGWLLDALDFCLRPLDSSLSLSLCSNDKATLTEPNEKTLKAIYRINLSFHKKKRINLS